MKVAIYLIFPLSVAVLWIMARHTTVPSEVAESGISKELYRISLYIYRKLKRRRIIANEQKIRSYLSMLGTGRGVEKAEEKYYAQKISIALLLAVSGSVLALAMYLSSLEDGEIRDGFYVDRSIPGEGTKSIELVAGDEEGNVLGEYQLEVNEKHYTYEEATELFERASGEIEELVLGNSDSLDFVTENLNLVKEIDAYPFEISWKVDDYEICSYDGEISWENIPSDGALITLTATYKYLDYRWEQVLYAKVMPKELSREELVKKEIKRLLSENDIRTENQQYLELPSSYQEQNIIWSEKKEDDSIIVLLLMLVGSAATFVLKDKELAGKIEERNTALLKEYPNFVSQMVLYLGAGMTMRNIFAILSENYVGKRKDGLPMNYLYEEVLRTTREISMGKSELTAYEDFGYRCGGQQYTRLSTLLSQNLRKGNSELLQLLSEEARKAQEDRLGRARKAGEEAGTKLLLPMVLMLLIVMIIIMIPAYMTF